MKSPREEMTWPWQLNQQEASGSKVIGVGEGAPQGCRLPKTRESRVHRRVHASWGWVPTASEGCVGTTLLHPETAGPAPTTAEGTAPAAAVQLLVESPPGGQGRWGPGESDVQSWVPQSKPCTCSLHPQPSSLCTLAPSPSPLRPFLPGCCAVAPGQGQFGACILGCLDPMASSASA